MSSGRHKRFAAIDCPLALDSETRAYNEAAFTYFLDIERKRFKRSNRPFTLLLADFGLWPGSDPRMEPEVASSVLSGLSQCLRDTDFVGWYVQEQVAGPFSPNARRGNVKPPTARFETG